MSEDFIIELDDINEFFYDGHWHSKSKVIESSNQESIDELFNFIYENYPSRVIIGLNALDESKYKKAVYLRKKLGYGENIVGFYKDFGFYYDYKGIVGYQAFINGESSQAKYNIDNSNTDEYKNLEVCGPATLPIEDFLDDKGEWHSKSDKNKDAHDVELNYYLSKAYEYYPNRMIVHFYKEHKWLAKIIAEIHKKYNYPDKESFFADYGFTYVSNKSSRIELNQNINITVVEKGKTQGKELGEDETQAEGVNTENQSMQIPIVNLPRSAGSNKTKKIKKLELGKKTIYVTPKFWNGHIAISEPANENTLVNIDYDFRYLVYLKLKEYCHDKSYCEWLDRITNASIGYNIIQLSKNDDYILWNEYAFREQYELFPLKLLFKKLGIYKIDNFKITVEKNFIDEANEKYSLNFIVKDLNSSSSAKILDTSDNYNCEKLIDNTIKINDITYERYNYELPLNVSIIAKNSFAGCTELTKIKIPDGVIEIEDDVELGATSITEIKIPGSVIRIGRNAFRHSKTLAKAVLSDGILYLGEAAFADCERLKEIIIPKSIRRIEKNLFDNCHELTKIYYAGSEEAWNKITQAGYDNLNSIIEFNSNLTEL